jgi:hypothetical protein
LPSASLRPYAMYVLKPKLGFTTSFGNITTKLKIPSLGSMNSWNGSEARNLASWRGRHSSK